MPGQTIKAPGNKKKTAKSGTGKKDEESPPTPVAKPEVLIVDQEPVDEPALTETPMSDTPSTVIQGAPSLRTDASSEVDIP